MWREWHCAANNMSTWMPEWKQLPSWCSPSSCSTTCLVLLNRQYFPLSLFFLLWGPSLCSVPLHTPPALDCSHFPDLASGLTCPMAQSRLSYSHCTVTQACHTIPPSRNWSGHMTRCFNLECQSHLDHDTNDSYTHLLPSPDKSIFSVQLTNYPNTNPHSYLITMYITIPVLIFFPLLPSAGCLRWSSHTPILCLTPSDGQSKRVTQAHGSE